MFAETVGLMMPCCIRLYLMLLGEGLPHKTVANALAGHQSGSQTFFLADSEEIATLLHFGRIWAPS